MNFEAECPYCGVRYEATKQDMHRHFLCKVCGKDFVVNTTPQKQSLGSTQTSQTPRSQTQKREALFDTADAAIAALNKFICLCIPAVAIGLIVYLVHNVNHRGKDDANAICPICWFTASGKNESEESVPSFVGTRELEDLLTEETKPDEKYLYEYTGDTLKINQVITSSPKGVLVSHKNWRFHQTIFIEMYTRDLVDGDALPPTRVQYVGIVTYKTILGAERSVRKFREVSKYNISESSSNSGK